MPQGDLSTQDIHAYSFMYGRMFYTGTIFRFTLKGGAALIHAFTPVVQPVTSVGPYSGGSSVREDLTLGMLFNPTAEMPIGRMFGLSLGVYANINPISPVCGVEFNLLFGKIEIGEGNSVTF